MPEPQKRSEELRKAAEQLILHSTELRVQSELLSQRAEELRAIADAHRTELKQSSKSEAVSSGAESSARVSQETPDGETSLTTPEDWILFMGQLQLIQMRQEERRLIPESKEKERETE